MMNRTVLVGRLTKDPELRQTGTGISVATFTLAVNRNFKTDNGPDADFVPVVVWRRQAENVAQYVGKGSLVGIDGRLQTRTYEAQDGSTRFVMEVVADSVQFLETRNANAGNAQRQSNQQQAQDVPFTFESSNEVEISDDDLPF